MKLAVVIPIFYKHFIDDLLPQIQRESELVDVVIVDNGEVFSKQDKLAENVTILHAHTNLRWTKGTNYGWRYAFATVDYDGYVLMNDDVRISEHFFEGLLTAYRDTAAGIIAPAYDDVWENQKFSYRGHADKYVPKRQHHTGQLKLDGTCIFVSDPCTSRVGYLDEFHFGETGWGAEWDLCIRAKRAYFDLAVTEMSYLNHFHQGTAKTIDKDWNYIASRELNGGMNTKYGEGWQLLLGGL